jgi:osomolarity two-component system, sensor histidine kinase SLN1
MVWGGLSLNLCVQIVVDRAWGDELKSSVVSQSEHGGNTAEQQGSHRPGTSTDIDSLAHLHGPSGFFGTLWLILRWRLWPATIDFFSLKFFDAASERHYAKEYWFMRKVLPAAAAYKYRADETLRALRSGLRRF